MVTEHLTLQARISEIFNEISRTVSNEEELMEIIDNRAEQYEALACIQFHDNFTSPDIWNNDVIENVFVTLKVDQPFLSRGTMPQETDHCPQ